MNIKYLLSADLYSDIIECDEHWLNATEIAEFISFKHDKTGLPNSYGISKLIKTYSSDKNNELIAGINYGYFPVKKNGDYIFMKVYSPTFVVKFINYIIDLIKQTNQRNNKIIILNGIRFRLT